MAEKKKQQLVMLVFAPIQFLQQETFSKKGMTHYPEVSFIFSGQNSVFFRKLVRKSLVILLTFSMVGSTLSFIFLDCATLVDCKRRRKRQEQRFRHLRNRKLLLIVLIKDTFV